MRDFLPYMWSRGRGEGVRRGRWAKQGPGTEEQDPETDLLKGDRQTQRLNKLGLADNMEKKEYGQ